MMDFQQATLDAALSVASATGLSVTPLHDPTDPYGCFHLVVVGPEDTPERPQRLTCAYVSEEAMQAALSDVDWSQTFA